MSDLPELPEPCAHMWQHEETGNTGFVQHAPQEELDQWQRMNRRRPWVGQMFTEVAMRAYARQAVAAEKAAAWRAGMEQAAVICERRARDRQEFGDKHGWLAGAIHAIQESLDAATAIRAAKDQERKDDERV